MHFIKLHMRDLARSLHILITEQTLLWSDPHLMYPIKVVLISHGYGYLTVSVIATRYTLESAFPSPGTISVGKVGL